MARFGVSYEDVEQACATIMAADLQPTIEKIRLQLGTGSHSTIARHLARWRELVRDYQQSENTAKFTPPDPVNRAVSQVWRNIQAEADKKLAMAESDFKQQQSQLQEENASLREQVLQLTQRDKELTDQLRALREKQQHYVRENDKSVAQNQELLILLKSSKEHLQEVKQSSKQSLLALKAEQSTTIKTIKQAYQNALQELKKDRHALADQLKTAQKNTDQQRKLITQTKTELTIVKKQLSDKNSSLVKSQRMLTQKNKQVQKLAQERDLNQREIKAVKKLLRDQAGKADKKPTSKVKRVATKTEKETC